MKFSVVKSVGDLCRLGCFVDSASQEIFTETPSTFLFLHKGSVPHLTLDNLEKIQNVPKIIQCSLNYVADKVDILETYNKDLASFIGLKNKPIFLCQNDPSQTDLEGAATKRSVGAWCLGGREDISVTTMIRLLKYCKPTIWQSLCDNETNIINASDKRLQKSVEKTIYLDKMLSQEIDKENISCGTRMTSHTGGLNWLRRRQCLERMFDSKTELIIMDGFFKYVDEKSQYTDNMFSIVEKVKRRITESNDVFVMLPKVMQPCNVVKAVKLGIDLFDGAFPYLLTESNIIWIYRNYKSNEKCDWIDVSDSIFHGQFDIPFDDKCDCFSCQNHTIGYVNHLIKTGEMLAKILIMIHNSSKYYQFFEEMRESMRNDEFEKFHEWGLEIECPSKYLTKAMENPIN